MAVMAIGTTMAMDITMATAILTTMAILPEMATIMTIRPTTTIITVAIRTEGMVILLRNETSTDNLTKHPLDVLLQAHLQGFIDERCRG